jgi:hypothetical protein
MTVANTIWAQISRSTKMACGARNPMGDANSLTFDVTIKRGQRHKVRVTLLPTDTYKVELIHIRGTNVTTQKECEDIYAENLSSVIYDYCNE